MIGDFLSQLIHADATPIKLFKSTKISDQGEKFVKAWNHVSPINCVVLFFLRKDPAIGMVNYLNYENEGWIWQKYQNWRIQGWPWPAVLYECRCWWHTKITSVSILFRTFVFWQDEIVKSGWCAINWWSGAAESNDDLLSADSQTQKLTQSQANSHKDKKTIIIYVVRQNCLRLWKKLVNFFLFSLLLCALGSGFHIHQYIYKSNIPSKGVWSLFNSKENFDKIIQIIVPFIAENLTKHIKIIQIQFY